ncbi:hypothetical protein BDV29DRAFT_121870 [Aspergillus leporis]|uniref:Uncharacterized protein n=1 Tax=Aspergillus leporis TaxID=41062 RepID=A0A5N5X5F4_9EURO|nr:hypothetical protein BDV29DRAFT_121870 [Aspergillus leporis]
MESSHRLIQLPFFFLPLPCTVILRSGLHLSSQAVTSFNVQGQVFDASSPREMPKDTRIRFVPRISNSNSPHTYGYLFFSIVIIILYILVLF